MAATKLPADAPITPGSLRTDGYAPIEAYAVISDQRTAALVAADGTVDWMCAPRFDDGPVCGRLLDPGRGGAFELRPTEPFAVQRRYVEDTNVLETTWTTASGTVRVTDALAVSARIQRFSQLLRRVECLAGEVEMVWRVAPRFGWAAEEPSVEPGLRGHVLQHTHVQMMVEAYDLGEPEGGGGAVAGTTTLRDGQSGLLSVLFTHSFPLLANDRDQCEHRIEETVRFWRSWLEPMVYEGPWKREVRRSALALGACVHDETGALVAAPTTSLPEVIGGSRNFDYRYCWVRDTSFALDAALRLGMAQFAQATLGWLLRSERHTHPRINVFFTLDGKPFCPQEQRDVPGYRGSRPVLDGNSAGHQLQLGCFGDLMETAWLFVRSGSPLDSYSGLHLAEVADHVCEVWRNPDSGLWELGDKRDYTHSKLQCWVTLDRAAKLADRSQLRRTNVGRWRSVQSEIGGWVRDHCIAPDGVVLRDGDGSGELDCAVLLAPRTNFLEASDPGFRRTMRRIRSELGAGGPLLYRYSGMQDAENAFLACSFWMVDALARAGDHDEASAMMDELVGLGNDVGLLSEELDPSDGGLRGNFPQALSHLALLNAAAVFTQETGGRVAGDAAAA